MLRSYSLFSVFILEPDILLNTFLSNVIHLFPSTFVDTNSYNAMGLPEFCIAYITFSLIEELTRTLVIKTGTKYIKNFWDLNAYKKTR